MHSSDFFVINFRHLVKNILEKIIFCHKFSGFLGKKKKKKKLIYTEQGSLEFWDVKKFPFFQKVEKLVQFTVEKKNENFPISPNFLPKKNSLILLSTKNSSIQNKTKI